MTCKNRCKIASNGVICEPISTKLAHFIYLARRRLPLLTESEAEGPYETCGYVLRVTDGRFCEYANAMAAR
jgi:hypothetical protein